MIKWVIRLAFLTALLGIVGTIVILHHFHQKQSDKNLFNDNKQQIEGKTIRKDSSLLKQERKQPPSLPALQTEEFKARQDTVSIVDSISSRKDRIAEPIVTKKAEVGESTIVFKKAGAENKPTKEAKKPAVAIIKKWSNKSKQQEKLFSVDELNILKNRTNAVKRRQHIFSNYIQIYALKSTDKRKIKQVENYFIDNKFSIAGKKIINEKIKGIKVNAMGQYIRIILGSF